MGEAKERSDERALHQESFGCDLEVLVALEVSGAHEANQLQEGRQETEWC